MRSGDAFPKTLMTPQTFSPQGMRRGCLVWPTRRNAPRPFDLPKADWAHGPRNENGSTLSPATSGRGPPTCEHEVLVCAGYVRSEGAFSQRAMNCSSGPISPICGMRMMIGVKNGLFKIALSLQTSVSSLYKQYAWSASLLVYGCRNHNRMNKKVDASDVDTKASR